MTEAAPGVGWLVHTVSDGPSDWPGGLETILARCVQMQVGERSGGGV